MRLRLDTVLPLLGLAAVVATTVASAQGGAFQGNNGPIAYTCGANICTINPDGTGKNPAFVSSASDLSWSSDQSGIVYLTSGGTLTVANNDNSFPGSIGAAAGSAQPSFSYDGNRIAYVRGGDIYTSSSFGGGEQALTAANSPSTEADPAYSPDGTKIAFASNRGTTGYDIWTVTLATGALHQVTNAIGDERSPTWSPSGLSIVYSAGPTHELFGAAAASSGIPTPTDLNVVGTDPSFSPDGTKIAFINASGNLAVMTNSATPTVTVLDSGTTNSQPDWEAVAPPSTPPSSFTGPPVNTAYPTINLTFGDTAPTVGDYVTASVGSWNGQSPLSYAYQWKRCDAADPHNGQCIDIANAQSSYYTPVAADYGKRLRVQVTATNSLGSTAQNSDVTAPVTAVAAKLRVTPEITGGNMVDSPLSVATGTWDGSAPLTYAYSWRRCNPPGDIPSCVPIAGAANAATYTPTVADIGFTIRVWITGTNLAGSDVGITNHTYPILDKPHFAPSAAAAPSVAGTVGIGRQMTATVGSFAGDAPITSTFVWQRCNAVGAACRTIPGATKVVYYPTIADVGATLRISVTATNAYGTMVTSSATTEPVVASPPRHRGRLIIGTQHDDYLAGGPYDDVIYGLGGNDTILGGAGDDRLYGGPGNDVITGGPGADKIYGGPGSDTIYAADGERDFVDCGPGADRAVVDSFDVVRNCEVVQVVSSPTGSASGSGTTP